MWLFDCRTQCRELAVAWVKRTGQYDDDICSGRSHIRKLSPHHAMIEFSRHEDVRGRARIDEISYVRQEPLRMETT